MTKIGAGETYSTEGPECPHCGRQYTADEPHYYDDNYTEDECDECGKKFKVEVHHSVSWACTTFAPQEQRQEQP
jgi:NAD-dependent SIR2 family protein deacetylase